MYLDRRTLSTYIWSDGLSTIPDNQNTLTPQSTDMSNAPKDPPFSARLHGIMTERVPTLRYAYVYIYVYAPHVSATVAITASTVSLLQQLSHRNIRYPTLAPTSSSTVPC